MKLIIDISNNFYMDIKEDKYHIYKGKLYEMIKNGTPLPKGHGDLKDVSNLLTVTDIKSDGSEVTYVFYDEIEDRPTIIEADDGE